MTAQLQKRPTRLFRAMRKGNGVYPLCGSEPNQLGIRLGIDIHGTSNDDDIVHPKTGGMSATPDDLRLLPIYKLPKWMGGVGKLPLFEIEVAVLDARLKVRPDPDDPERHAFVEPATSMTVKELQSILCATRAHWREVLK